MKTTDVKVKKHAEVSIINPDLGVEKAKFVKGTAIFKAKRIIILSQCGNLDMSSQLL